MDRKRRDEGEQFAFLIWVPIVLVGVQLLGESLGLFGRGVATGLILSLSLISTSLFWRLGRYRKTTLDPVNPLDPVEITNSVELKKSLLDSEAMFRKIAENLTEVVWVVTADLSEVLYVNPAYERVWGRTRQSVYENPSSYLDAVHPDDRAMVDAEAKKLLDEGQFHAVYRLIRPDGSICWVSDHSSQIKDANGQITSIVGVARDVTERKLAEAALQKQLELQAQFTKVAASVPGGIFSFQVKRNGAFCMPFTAPAMEDLIGIPRAVLASSIEPLFDQIHVDDIASVRNKIRLAISLGSSWHDRFRFDHPTKGARILEGWAQPHHDQNESTLWHGFMMDVTDRNALEEAQISAERFAASVFYFLEDELAVLDENGTILNVNRAWNDFSRRNDAPWPIGEGSNYLEVCDAVRGIEQPEATTFANGIRDVIAGRREFFEMEYPCHSPTQQRWFLGRVSPFLGEGPRRVIVSHGETTARVLATRVLAERERMLAQSQAMAHVGSWELDLIDLENMDKNGLRWSDECYRIFGYEPGQVRVTNELFFQSVHPDDREAIGAAIRQALKERRPYEIKHRLVLPDGRERLVHEWGEIVLNAKGQPIQFRGTCQDVTEQWLSERQLRESEARFERFLDNVPASTWIADRAGRVHYTSPIFRRTLRMLEGNPINLNLRDLFPEEYASAYLESSEQVFQTGEPQETRERGERIDGTIGDFLVYKFLLADGSPDPLLGGVAIDVTESTRRDQQIRNQAFVLENVSQPMHYVDQDGIIRYTNRAFDTMYGFEKGEVIGKHVVMLVHLPEDEAMLYFQRLRDEVVEHGKWSGQFETLRKDGTLIITNMTIQWLPIADEACFVSVQEDITDSVRRDQEIRNQAFVLENISQAMHYVDREGFIRYTNRAFDEMYGLEKGEVLGKHVATLIPLPEEVAITFFMKSRDEVLKYGEWTGLLEVARKDGSHIATNLTVQSLPMGDELCFVAVQEDITDRKKAEDALRESEEFNRQVVAGLQEGLVVLDQDLNYRLWNKFQEDLTGIPAEQVLGKHAMDACPGPQVQQCLTFLKRALAGESVVMWDQKIDTPHLKRETWLSRHAGPLRNARGEIVGVISTAQDVTERKQADLALARSEDRLNLALEAASMGVWEVEVGTGKFFCSPMFLKIHGLDAPPQGTQALLMLVHPDDRRLVLDASAGALLRNEEYATEVRVIRSDGEIRWTSSVGRVYRDETGKPIRLIGATQDITERKQADEAALLWKRIFEKSEFGLAVADTATNTFIATNAAFARQRGYTCAELAGQPISVIYAPEFREDLDQRLRAIDVAGHLAFEAVHRRKDGSCFPVQMEVTGIRNAQGQFETRVAYASDITERKRAEASLIDYTARLEFVREIDEAILAAHSASEIALIAIRHLTDLLPCSTGGVALFDQVREEIIPIAGVGSLANLHPPGGRFHFLEGDSLRMIGLQQGKVDSVQDLDCDDSALNLISDLKTVGLRSYLNAPLNVKNQLIGGILLGADQPNVFTQAHIEIVKEVAAHLAVAINQAVLHDEVQAARVRLEALSRQLLRVQEDERRHLARELHDEIGQALTAVKINLQEIGRSEGDVSQRLAESEEIVERSLQQVRGMALDLRPSLLDDLGLVAALRWYVRRQAERTGLTGRFVADPDEIKVDPEIATACFRVVQEALTNVARHSKATRFSVDLLQYSGGLQLVVRDDGVGFDSAVVTDPTEQAKSVGLSGMRERVELVGGRIAFESVVGGGTEIQVEMPESLSLHSASPS